MAASKFNLVNVPQNYSNEEKRFNEIRNCKTGFM